MTNEKLLNEKIAACGRKKVILRKSVIFLKWAFITVLKTNPNSKFHTLMYFAENFK